ncbi:MAG: hypothetical protein Fur0020_11560 [Thermodesulfovibrionia bacterium]
MRKGLDIVTLIIAIIFVLTLISSVTISIYSKKEGRINTELNAQLREIQSMQDRFIRLKEIIDLKEKKIGLTKTEGVISTLAKTINPLGIKANAIRPLQKNMIEGYSVEDAEVEIKDIDLNGIVNLLYRIENSPSPLRIKSAFIKTSFDDPNRFIIRLTVSLVSSNE